MNKIAWILIGSVIALTASTALLVRQNNRSLVLKESQDLGREWQDEQLKGLGEIIFTVTDFDAQNPKQLGIAVSDIAQDWVKAHKESPSHEVIQGWFREASGKKRLKVESEWLESYKRSINWWYAFDDDEWYSKNFGPHLDGYISLQDRLQKEGHTAETVEEASLEYIVRVLRVYE